jgi:hypothetical protein
MKLEKRNIFVGAKCLFASMIMFLMLSENVCARNITYKDADFVASLTWRDAHASCVTPNETCYYILDVEQYAYKRGWRRDFAGPKSALCEEINDLEAFRQAFLAFFPYQPGLHGARASVGLDIVIFEVWSCQRIQQRQNGNTKVPQPRSTKPTNP